MKKLLIVLAMLFIGCSDTGNSVAVDYDQTDVENDSTEFVIDTIDTIDTIDSVDVVDTIDTIDTVDSVKDTIIDTKEDTVVVSSSSNVENESSSSINNIEEESSSSMENVVECSSSSEIIVESSSSELIVSSSSSEKKVESSSSSKIVESSSSEEIVNSSSSIDEDYVDENEPKSTEPHYVELDELKLNGFRVENNIAYLSWENNTDYTMQINVEYHIECKDDLFDEDEELVEADSTIMYTIKANSVKEKAIYKIKNNAQQCVGEVKTITATENDKSNFAGWEWGSDRGMKYISFRN